ncbi:putative glutathione-dependent formaldehyde-activating protein [Cordyceps militaris CM01]|uniref:Glutathione-dependent formaldehyde-activating n=2 Tax=Cordyceps militaris TaxID=73501 RepID=A0A2H4SCR3_CORMI|nr:putative glutathione-dependent formaldehyde-activating protein [Cordyceps militaris CM01]ATY60900.1 glutathione-dependent formaldehyde-activating [Cordyceps militaris]EGX95185.1 putative glutathione-dependent formaldehyde-activating protein [Cordyceps militaris CM01]
MTTNLPTRVSGGCLCQGVRYTITFPPSHDFLNATSTCQCSQCRKQTGSLVFRAHKVPRGSVAWTARATLHTYRASPGNARGFCGRCGALLFWAADAEDALSVCVGTLDDDVLREHGRVLTYAERHLFCVNDIQGVTDHLPGKKYPQSD